MEFQNSDERKAWFCNKVHVNKLSLFRMAMSILHDEEDAKDAVSEAVYISYDRLESLRNNKSFKSWIMRILINESYKIYNQRKRSIQLEDYQSTTQYYFDEENASLWSAIEELNNDTRMLVILFYFDGMNVKEISKITGLSQSAIKTRLHRARSQLKTMLMKEE